MIKNFLIFFTACLSSAVVFAQDTLLMNEVRINTSIVKQRLLRTTAAAAIIDSAELKNRADISLVPALNNIPGVRMEERSPGSYRLSLRGSLLRSPFGIRNVKVYINEYPLTDAGGNTYLNVIAMDAIHSIEIFKGPDGSLFGANSGGVVSINNTGTTGGVRLGISGGSYGLFKQSLGFTKKSNKHLFNFF